MELIYLVPIAIEIDTLKSFLQSNSLLFASTNSSTIFFIF